MFIFGCLLLKLKNMSRNISLLIITFCLFGGLSIFYSCTKIEHDNEAPKIVSIDSPVVDQKLYLDSFAIFKATFSDNNSLSSYSIKIWDPALKDTLVVKNPAGGDSLAILNDNFQKVPIFGLTNVDVRHDFYLPPVKTVRGKQYKVRTGVYRFKVVVADTDGNRDSTEFNVQVVPAAVKEVKPD